MEELRRRRNADSQIRDMKSRIIEVEAELQAYKFKTQSKGTREEMQRGP